MKLPGFVTPNFITIMRLLLVPVGAYTLFKNGGDDPTWQYISWCVFFILGMSDVLVAIWHEVETPLQSLESF
jgi:CDP-diacylglycerol--glycerol-3-phosphate 3-phosphatidyltransferase